MGPNGSVGDLNWAGPGIEPGWLYTDLNQDVPDVKVPYDAASATPLPSSSRGVYTLGSQNYGVVGDLQINNGETILINGANAVLYVTGGLIMKGTSFIVVTNGGSLKIYLGSPTGTSSATTFTQVNSTGNASTFQVYALPSTTSMTWNGNSQYTGTIYAPEAAVTLGGGGSSPLDFQGAFVSGNVYMNGHFSVHYDQYLKRSGPPSGFTVASWQEL